MRLLRLFDTPQPAPADPARTMRTIHATSLRARALSLLAAAAMFATTGTPLAAQDTIPAYAADAIYRTTDGSESVGRVVKSGANMRLEFTEAGRAVVQILRRTEGTMYVLDPASRSYFKIQGEPDLHAGAAAYEAPCDQSVAAITCRFLGNEVTSGITAEVWEIGQPNAPPNAPPGAPSGEAAQVSRILWDGARHRALRQEYPDGTVMALVFKAMVQIESRNVEHWIINVNVPGQAPLAGAWYYDPELRVELREELPTGEVRTLRNIVIGAVDPAAFAVPTGWSEVTPPQPTGPGGGAGVPTPPSAN